MTTVTVEHTEPMLKSVVSGMGVDAAREAAKGWARHRLAQEIMAKGLIKCVQKPDPQDPNVVLFTFSLEIIEP